MFPRPEKTARRRAFTLVELLVSMAVVTLVMVVTTQLVGKASSISAASNKSLDTATMARTVFERLGEDLAGASLNGGPTILYYSGSSGGAVDPAMNSALGFICKTRARKLSSDDAVQDVRGIVVGYKIRPTATSFRAGTTVNLPLINRGDAEFTYSKNGSTTTGSPGKFVSSVWDLFGASGAMSLPNDLAATSNDANLLTWQGYGDGVLRFHVSFVLDNGRIVQSLQESATGAGPAIDVTYANFPSNGGPGNCQAVAFSAATTKDLNQRYVTGLIVGIVTLDQKTLSLGYLQNTSFASDLATTLGRPTKDTETPLRVWQANTANVTPPPVRQNLHCYQRYYAVSL